MKQPLIRLSILLGMGLMLVAASVGCKKDNGVSSFTEPKEFPPELSFPDDLRWTLPTGWKQVSPPPGRMGIRATAAIQVAPDDSKLLLTISKLGERGGDLHMNIARWAELFLNMAPPQDTDKIVTHHQNGDLASDVVDMSNTASPPQRLLGAVVPHGADTWAFKLSGPADVIAGQKDRFDAFIASLHFAAAAPPPIAEEAPSVPAPSAAAEGVEGVRWALPAGWSAEPGTPGSPRVATIHPDSNGQTGIKVSRMGSIGGGLLLNVNRWRGEVGLDAVGAEQADRGEQRILGETTWTIHAYTGPKDGGMREVVALTEAGGTTWYFKLFGPTQAVEAQQAAFDQFLKSMQFAR